VPFLELGIEDKAKGAALQGSLVLRVSPVVDRLSTAIYDRADVIGNVAWQASKTVAFAGTAAGGQVLEGPQRNQQIASGEVRISWTPGPHWGFSTGGRMTWQKAPGGVPFRDWNLFVALTLADQEKL
jgi:hypothetical protein